MSIGGSESASHSSSRSNTSGGSAVFLGPQAKALRGINLDFARQVLQELQNTSGFANSLQQIPGLVSGFSDLLAHPTTPEQDALYQKQLDILNNAGQATPEQQQLIQEAADRAIASGQSDINNQLALGLRSVRNEVGPALGLRPGDTPLIDRGNLLAQEALRENAQLINNVRGQQATNTLNYPLASASTYGGLTQAANQLQAQLRAQAFQNRLQLTGGAGNLGLGLSTAYNPAQGFLAISSADPHSFEQHTHNVGESQGASASQSYGLGGAGAGGGGGGGFFG